MVQTSQKFKIVKEHYFSVICCCFVVATFVLGILLAHQEMKVNANTVTVSGSSPLSATANATVTVSAACSFSNSDTTHSETVSNGLYYSNIGVSTMNVKCNDSGGYAVYAVGYTNNIYGTTYLRKSTGSDNIPTGTDTGDVSNWSMRVASDPSGYIPGNMSIVNSFSNDHVIPATYTKIVNYSSATDATIGSIFNVFYAARISSTQPAGTYIGKVKYVVVHPSSAATPSDNITFVVASDNIKYILVLAKQNLSISNHIYIATSGNNISIPVNSNNYEYIVTVIPEPGYKLSGWLRDTYSGELASSELLTTTYTPQANNGGGETLVAVPTTGNYVSMQNMSNINDCPTTGINMSDTRNGESYTVARIGNYCYMLSDLRLSSGISLNSSTSDITPNSTYSTFIVPSSGSGSGLNARMLNPPGSPYYAYNWAAAKANPHDYGTAVFINTDYSLGSICPKGWTLPTYSELTPAQLWNNGENPGMLTSAPGFSGVNYNVYWGSDARVEGNGGPITGAYSLRLMTTGVDRASISTNYLFKVRCVAKAHA